jgi:hypothetical protein
MSMEGRSGLEIVEGAGDRVGGDLRREFCGSGFAPRR